MDETKEKELEGLLREYLKSLGVKKEEVLNNTPRRWMEFLKKYTEGFKEFNDIKNFELQTGDFNEMVVLETGFSSICEHHLLPYFGKVFVGYLPTTHVIGVSKIVKLIKHISMKPSIQEELTEEISKTIRKIIPNCAGVAVIMHGFHTCVGTRYKEGWLTTASMHGVFKHNPFAKNEFLDYVKHRIKREVSV